MNVKHFKVGEIVFHEGEISHEAFFLISGAVEITIQSGDGPLVLGRLGAGEVFGEMGMITDHPRSATATAIENTTVESINEAEFEEAILARPDRMHAYLSTLFDRIRTTDLLLRMEGRKRPSAQRCTTSAVQDMRTALHGKPPSGGPAAAGLKHRILIRSAEGNPRPVDFEIERIPFRIGRAYADAGAALFARNDLSIADSRPHQVSRNHCEIDSGEQGLVVRDRGSTLGTTVNNVEIGGHADALVAPLHDGENLLLLGNAHSPYRFIVTVEIR